VSLRDFETSGHQVRESRLRDIVRSGDREIVIEDGTKRDIEISRIEIEELRYSVVIINCK
jgi:hypothetical protein